MVIHTCPYLLQNLDNPAIQSKLGQSNLVALHHADLDFTSTHIAPFSVKFVLTGNESYEFDNRRLTVTTDNFLIMNRNQPYSSSIESRHLTTSLCVFFSNDLYESAYRFTRTSEERALDEPCYTPDGHFNFHQHLRWKDQQHVAVLQRLNDCSHSDLSLDQWFCSMMELAINDLKTEIRQRENVRSKKPGTRKEIHKRLSAAIDYIHEYSHTSLSLTQLSTIACLSMFHFLRSFKEVFQVTPHQYLTTIRLKRASEMLRKTELHVSEIALICGFNDHTTFTRQFGRHNGISPAHFRQQHRMH